MSNDIINKINTRAVVTKALGISDDGYTTLINTLNRLDYLEASDFRRGTPLFTVLRYTAALFSADPKKAAAAMLAISGSKKWSLPMLIEILEDIDGVVSVAQVASVIELARTGISYAEITRRTGVPQGACGRVENLFGFQQRREDEAMDAAIWAVQRGLSSHKAQAQHPVLNRFGQWNVNKLMGKARKVLAEVEGL
jgi:uncharacterized protein YerC